MFVNDVVNRERKIKLIGNEKWISWGRTLEGAESRSHKERKSVISCIYAFLRQWLLLFITDIILTFVREVIFSKKDAVPVRGWGMTSKIGLLPWLQTKR